MGRLELQLKHSKNAIMKTSDMMWTVETLNEAVDAELDGLFGLERVREPHVKHVRGAPWEMRMKGRVGISRALYVTEVGRRVVVVRVFVKKTRTVPSREIELALRRAREVLG